MNEQHECKMHIVNRARPVTVGPANIILVPHHHRSYLPNKLTVLICLLPGFGLNPEEISDGILGYISVLYRVAVG